MVAFLRINRREQTLWILKDQLIQKQNYIILL